MPKMTKVVNCTKKIFQGHKPWTVVNVEDTSFYVRAGRKLAETTKQAEKEVVKTKDTPVKKTKKELIKEATALWIDTKGMNVEKLNEAISKKTDEDEDEEVLDINKGEEKEDELDVQD